MRKSVIAISIAAVAIVLSGCAPSTPTPGDASTPGAPPETVDLTVGVLPAAELAALQLGIDQGFFEEEGLNITPQVGAAAATLIPALVSGELDMMWSSPVATVNGLVKGLPLKVLAPGAATGENCAIIVAEGSDISSLEDLQGKRIGVPALGSLADYSVRGAFAEADLDPAGWEPVEIGFPDVAGALAADRIDAAVVVEPFLTMNSDAGASAVTYPFMDINDGEPLQATEWITTTQFADANPDVVERFTRAVAKSNEYASTHEDEARTAVGKLLTQVDPAVIQKMALPTWQAEFDVEDYQTVIDLLVDYGGLTGAPDAVDVVPAQ